MSISYAIGILLLAWSWLQPMHLLPWVSWHSELLAFFSFVLIAISAVNTARAEGKRVGVPKIIWPLVMLALATLVQYAMGLIGFVGELFVVMFYFVAGAVALTAGFNIAIHATSSHNQQVHIRLTHVDIFACTVLVAALGSVVLALVQAVGVWDDFGWINRTSGYRRAGGNLSQPNHLATLVVMGIASLSFCYESRKLGRVLATLLFGILTLGVAVTESRSGMLSCFVIGLWWWVYRRALGARLSDVSVAIGGGVLTLLFILWPKLLEYVQSGGSLNDSALASISLSTAGRSILWPQMLGATLQRPWFGWGVGGVSMANNAVLHDYAEGLPITYAHNILLDGLVDFGIPLTLLLAVLIFYWLIRRLLQVRTREVWYCIAIVLPVGVHSMFEFPFAYAYFLLPALFAVGLLAGGVGGKAWQIRWTSAAMFVCTLTAALLWSAVEYIALEEDYRIARFEVLKVGRTPEGYQRPKTHLLTQLAGQNEVFRIVPAPGMSPDRIELLHRVAVRFPVFATQNRYALSLALNGSPEEAVRQLKVMRVMHGERAFSGIRAYWQNLAQNQYPQLQELQIP